MIYNEKQVIQKQLFRNSYSDTDYSETVYSDTACSEQIIQKQMIHLETRVKRQKEQQSWHFFWPAVRQAPTAATDRQNSQDLIPQTGW